jgi:hypothetical protein
MPSYTEGGSFPPLDGRPVGQVPPAPKEEPKTTEDEPQPCPRCGKDDCKHPR